jgi:hypothetical protein
MRATVHSVPFGDAGTLQTLELMGRLARAGAVRPAVRSVSTAIAHGTGTDAARQIAIIRKWLRRNVAFIRDPLPAELLHEPEAMLLELGRNRRLAVDCDDVAILAAALGMSIGLRARFVAVGHSGGWDHVFAELSDPDVDDWRELDITRPFQGIGAEYTDAIFFAV